MATKEISQYAKDIVDKGWLVQPSADIQQQMDAYVAQKKSAARAANPYMPQPITGNATTPSGAVVNATTGALVSPPPTTIDASSLGKSSVAIPTTPQPSPLAFPTPSIEEQAKSFAQATTPTEPTATEKFQTDLQKRFADISTKLFGKPAAQQAAEQAQGVPQKSQAVSDIQAQINQLKNETLQAQLRAEERQVPMFAIGGEQATIERESTIKALQLNSFLYAAQGNLATAQDMADRAVRAEFEPVEMEIDFIKDFLEINKDNLSREDKKRAEQLQLQLGERERLLNEQKETKTAISNVGIDAANAGADAVTLRAIQNATTPEEALQIAVGAGIFQKTLKRDTQVVKLDNGNTVLMDTQTGEIIKNYGGAKPSEGVSGGLVDAILLNPQLFNNLTPTMQGQIIPQLQASGFRFPAKLSAEQQKTQQNALSALQAIATLEGKLFDPDGTINRTNLNIAITGLGTLAFARREAIDVLTRIRTGAALNESEQKFYAKQFPRAIDDKETIETKLTQLKALYAGLAGTSLTLQSPNGEAYLYDNMFNPENRDEVRQAIGAGYKIIDY